jgi:hypothetical protein
MQRERALGELAAEQRSGIDATLADLRKQASVRLQRSVEVDLAWAGEAMIASDKAQTDESQADTSDGERLLASKAGRIIEIGPNLPRFVVPSEQLCVSFANYGPPYESGSPAATDVDVQAGRLVRYTRTEEAEGEIELFVRLRASDAASGANVATRSANATSRQQHFGFRMMGPRISQRSSPLRQKVRRRREPLAGQRQGEVDIST